MRLLSLVALTALGLNRVSHYAKRKALPLPGYALVGVVLFLVGPLVHQRGESVSAC